MRGKRDSLGCRSCCCLYGTVPTIHEYTQCCMGYFLPCNHLSYASFAFAPPTVDGDTMERALRSDGPSYCVASSVAPYDRYGKSYTVEMAGRVGGFDEPYVLHPRYSSSPRWASCPSPGTVLYRTTRVTGIGPRPQQVTCLRA